MEHLLDWLQKWYISQCDGDWEHEYGIKIETLDNPGWAISIDLSGTMCENKSFLEIDLQKDKYDWVQCNVSNSQFKGTGGPCNLMEILQIFRNWVDSNQ